MASAHIINLEEHSPSFFGQLKTLKIPFTPLANLTKLPKIFATKAGKDMKRYLNLEPFIPICKLANELNKDDPR